MQSTPAATQSRETWDRTPPYDRWVESLEIPVHSGYYVEDIRTVEVGWWPERECNAAILKLAGQEGVSEVRVTEIPAGKTTAPVHMALDELVYVADGRGLTSITAAGRPARTFEWQKHSLFMVPRNHTYQLSNAQGDRAARLLHYNALPMAMQLIPDPEFFFREHPADVNLLYGSDGEAFYSEAKVVRAGESVRGGAYWVGNFFPDMRAWDRLVAFKGRGAGGHVVWIRYPQASLWNHMSVFGSQTYKKGHRHGPGTMIVIPAGEGYSFMWPEGGERVHIPWHEASVFVPPNRWFHQHFNVSAETDRYLAFHSPRGGGGNERVEDRARDQIEYPDEDPIIRETFERELGKRGLKSIMPEIAYQDRNFEWEYGES